MGLGIFYPNALITNPFTLTQLEQDISTDFNFESATITAPGSMFPGFSGYESQEPKVESSTTQIKAVLDAMTEQGVAVPLTGSDSVMEYQKAKNLGGRELPGEAVHTEVRASEALFFWRSIQAADRGFATLDFSWMPIIDALGNPPVVVSTDVSLAGVPVVNEAWRSGPVNMTIAPADGGANEVYTLCNDGWSWDNGIQVKQKKCAGLTADSYAAIESSVPRLTVPTENVADVMSLYSSGSIVSIDAYLRKAQPGGENIAPATAEHIRFSSVVGSVAPTNAKQFIATMHSWTVNTAVAIPT